jgi:hypothetical protein
MSHSLFLGNEEKIMDLTALVEEQRFTDFTKENRVVIDYFFESELIIFLSRN